jgi:malonyl-CoA/methylmalonyl-CoA synthetase
MNVLQAAALSLAGRAGDAGLEWAGQTLAFGELHERARRTTSELRARGLGRGDRVALFLANRPEMIDLYLGALALGAVVVPINVLYRDRELSHILADAEPQAIVADGALPGGTTVPLWAVDELASGAARQPPDPWETPLVAADPAAIIYTSGTTGAAKGAVLTHGNFVANASALVSAWQITGSDRLLLALPLFHVHGLANGVHTWLMSGARLRLLPRFDHRTAARDFLDFEPTVFFGVPTMFVRMLEWDDDVAARIGRTARLLVSGSAPLPVDVFEAVRARFGHAILERYGMTETLMTLSNPYAGERRPGTVGFPLPGVSARLLDGEGGPVPQGALGEIHVKGPAVFAGYWRRPEATSAAFTEEGDFRTGDLAERSADGYYRLRARRSEVIISGGFNIYPREIEEVLLTVPSVREAAVVGEADPRRGEVPVAFVVPANPSSPFDPRPLEEACASQLASFKVPRAFVAVTSLPRNALGKVQAHRLRRTPG